MFLFFLFEFLGGFVSSLWRNCYLLVKWNVQTNNLSILVCSTLSVMVLISVSIICVRVVVVFCSSKSKIPVWPFVVLSCFGGAYALIPYFVLWMPPAPTVAESELRRWPLNFLESKITAGVRTLFTLNRLSKKKITSMIHCLSYESLFLSINISS